MFAGEVTPARRHRATKSFKQKLIVNAGRLAFAATLALVPALVAPPAGHADGRHHRDREPVKVITEGLNGPRQVSSAGRWLLVAESDTGNIVAVDRYRGRKHTVVEGLSIPQGVAGIDGRLYIATGEPGPEEAPPEGEPPAAMQAPEPAEPQGSAIMVARPGGEPRLFADLMAYELENNPDGQIQFGPDGAPLDALSNPYYVLRDRSRHGFLLVADAGANAVLAVDRRGNVSTFFVPPTVTTGVCAEAENNTTSGFGCDAVPTGLAYGPNGLLYVSALTAEVPGEGRVYVLDRRGNLVRTISGFSAPTGVAVDDHGTIFVSELLEGAPAEDPPPPDFDPADVGQIVAVTRSGRRYQAQVTMPSGLLFSHGKLYASAWSIASFLGIADAGQVVTVSKRAFSR